MDTPETADQIRKDSVKVSLLMGELVHAVNNAVGWAENVRLAEDTSWCIWAGQSDDGLKHQFPGDELPPFPWENASDTRIRLVEEKVREFSRLCQVAARRGNWQFQGENGLSFVKARERTQLLKWQEQRQIPNAKRERDLMIVWAALYGVSIMGLGWSRREELALRRVDMEVLMDRFAERFPDGIEVLGEAIAESLMVDTEDSTKYLDAWLKEFWPQSTPSRRKDVIEALRKGEAADLQEVRVVAEHPDWRAMVPMRDVFFPLDTDDVSRARWVATRDWLTRGEVLAKEDWSDEDKAELLKHAGKCSTIGIDNYQPSSAAGRRRWGRNRPSAFTVNSGRESLYEVFTFYHYGVDEDGLTALYCTEMSPHVMATEGADQYRAFKQGIYDDGTGSLPFEHFTMWDDRRPLLECEGLPHLLYTYQSEKKTLRDYRIDGTSISILPPVRRSARDQAMPLILGPDVPVFETVPGSTQWMDPPANRNGMAIELERAIDAEVNRFAGQPGEGVPQPIIQIHSEHTVEHFFDAYARILRRTMQLNQRYLPETTVMMVTASQSGPFQVSREEIAGQFDISISFDVRELDIDFALKKFKAALEVARSADRDNVIDHSMLTRLGLLSIDPTWADLLIRDENPSSAEEIRETMTAVSDIVSGQQPQLTEQINSAVRLQYMSQQMQSNPMLIAISQNPEDPRHEALKQYLEHLNFIYGQQYIQPQTGRLGVNQNQPGETTNPAYA